MDQLKDYQRVPEFSYRVFFQRASARMPNALGLTLKSIVFIGKMLPGMERTVEMLFLKSSL